jgi:hypothetical protein
VFRVTYSGRKTGGIDALDEFGIKDFRIGPAGRHTVKVSFTVPMDCTKAR